MRLYVKGFYSVTQGHDYSSECTSTNFKYKQFCLKNVDLLKSCGVGKLSFLSNYTSLSKSQKWNYSSLIPV